MNAHQAETIARMVHRGQLYADQPYIEAHVAKVVERVIQEGGDQDAIVVAWLHDVLEDSNLTAESQPMLVLSRPQAAGLAAITRKEGEEYSAYIARVVQSPVARLVKYCDLLSNLAAQPPEKNRRRYLAALEIVRDSLDTSRQLPRRSMMRASSAAACELDSHLKGVWAAGDGLQRASKVLHWCHINDWPLASQVTVERLTVAMQRMPYWQQGPSNYFDMARALSAALLVAP
jgi:hypothetical protein